MRVLITGLEGFTGQHMLRDLVAHGHNVIGLKSDLRNIEELNAEIKHVQPDWVVHLAGIANVTHATPNDFYEVNLIGTRNLLAALSASGKLPKCILLASSATVYGNAQGGRLTEHTPPNPANDYAVSKLAMEHMSQLWQRKLPIVIVRPFNYTGVGQSLDYIVPKIIDHHVRRASTIELGNLEAEREFNDVRSVVKIYRKILEISPKDVTLNVSSGITYSIKQIISTIESITKQTITIKQNNSLFRENEIKRLCGDNTRLRRLIGEIEIYPIQDTLNTMLNARDM